MQAIAAAGVTSRRGADELIFGGKVTVNGAVVEEPGRQVDLRKDKVGRAGGGLLQAGPLWPPLPLQGPPLASMVSTRVSASAPAGGTRF